MSHLESERLYLRPLGAGDAVRFAALAGEEEVSRLAVGIPHPLSPTEAELWVSACEAAWAEENGYHFAIVEKASGLMIGSIGIALDRRNHRAEVGYWLGKEWWGKGYATEAGRLILRFGFGALGLNRIFANHTAGNNASGHVLQKLGMTYEGTFREDAVHRGRFVDLLYYAILRSEWEQQPER